MFYFLLIGIYGNLGGTLRDKVALKHDLKNINSFKYKECLVQSIETLIHQIVGRIMIFNSKKNVNNYKKYNRKI